MVRDRVLMMTMGVSALFHLSMFTLFSIYVWVPVYRPKYAQLEIINLDTVGTASAVPGATLRIPAFDETAEGTAEALPQLDVSLPEIALPTLDLERPRMIVSSLKIRSEYGPEAPQGSWARFIGTIGKLDDRLRGYTPLQSVFPEEAAPARSAPIAQLSDGLSLYVEWLGEPRDRELQLAAPIDSSWRTDPKSVRTPLSLPFKVNAAGEVVYVLPHAPGDEILASVSRALLNFRFAPLEDPRAPDQYGTIIVAPESAP